MNTPNILLRVLAGVAALASTVYAVFVIRAQLLNGSDLFGISVIAGAAAIAFFGWAFSLRGYLPLSRIRIGYALVGGCILGGIALLAGYVGPILFTDSNQGPLLGMFVTGPLGFALGSVCGWIFGYIRVGKKASN